MEERQRQLQELSAKLSKSERELRAAKKQAALAATSENGEEEVVEDEVVDTVIEGDEPVSESVPALDETAAAQATESGFVQADMPMQILLSRQRQDFLIRNLQERLFRQPEKPVPTETDADKTQID